MEVDHFTKFAVLAVEEEQTLIDIKGSLGRREYKTAGEIGAIGGYPDRTFKPNNRITRAEFATILVKAFELQPQPGKVFADTAGHWARDTIATAAHYGIVNGMMPILSDPTII